MAEPRLGIGVQLQQGASAWVRRRIQECTHCRGCGQQITPLDRYCVNCGQQDPARVSVSAAFCLLVLFGVLAGTGAAAMGVF